MNELRTENDIIEWKNDRLYMGGRVIDIGFVIKVSPIDGCIEVPRSYAPSKLYSRMKSRGTNGDITDISESVEEGIKAGKNKQYICVYNETIDSLVETLLGKIRNYLNDSKFEKLICWYMKKIGADKSVIPAKNELGKADGADADIVATFHTINHTILIQAKYHTDLTDETAVEQIVKYYEQKREDNPGYSYALWVISTGEGFTETAEKLAIDYGVRLIEGSEFMRMLIDEGLYSIDEPFS